MTAAELMAKLGKDPEYQARVAERDARIAAADESYRAAERPVVNALRRAGVAVHSVWDLVNSADPYPDAVPVLLEHLQKPYPDRVREGIARALAVSDARSGWAVLVSEFEKDPDETTLGSKWGLACALAVTASDDVLDDVLRLLRDRRHGRNRAPLLEALARSRRPDARSRLAEFAEDPDLADDVRDSLARSR